MRNLVLGSEGFVGKPLCRYLEALGDEVVRFDLKRHPEEDGRHCSIPVGDCDAVYFLAWEVGGAKYLYRDEVQAHQMKWNVRLMANVFEQLEAAKVPFLFVSSQLAEENGTVYGVTKRLGEVWTKLCQRGLTVRLWNVYGPLEQPSDRSHVSADLVHQAVDDGEMRLLTDGTELRQFIHIDDVCRAFHMVMAQEIRGAFDVTSFEWVSIWDLAQQIGELTGAPVVRGNVKGRTAITPIQGKIPGWYPSVQLKEGLRRMVADARERS